MKNVCSVWVPSELSEKNREDRIACCRRILENVSQCESGVYCVQDELWVNWIIVKSKQQNMTWIKKGGKRSQVVKPKLTVKIMMLLIAFTCSPARFSITALPRGVTVTAGIWWNSLNLRATVLTTSRRTKSPSRSCYCRWTTHGNTGATVLSQSPYSPDLNLCDRFRFTILQRHYRGVEYADGDELERDV